MTVIVLTSGTSWSVPADWTAVNQVETWGGGSGGNYGSDGGSGGSGGYSSSSNIAGLSGSITIGIGAAGAAGTSGSVNGGSGGATWFNGAALSSSTVGSNGGVGASTNGTGASTTGAKGTTLKAGTNGSSSAFSTGAGGPGAPGPQGLGVAGGAGGSTNGGAGGAGDNGSGGAGGSAGTSSAEAGNGVANSNGGGGGGGGGSFGTSNGGKGGLPGGAGGGGDLSGTTNNGGVGGAGQIRITYTPAASSIGASLTDLPPLFRYKPVLKQQRTEKDDFQGWQQSPLSLSSLPEVRQSPYDVPSGKWNWTRYQDWQQPPLSSNAPPLLGATSTTAYPGPFNWTRYQPWINLPRPPEFLVPFPSFEVPKGRYNNAAYQDWQRSPQALSIAPGLLLGSYDLPVTRNPRIDYSGWANFQPPGPGYPSLCVWEVPRGTWKSANYQDWTVSFQRLEYQAPLPSMEVPRGVSKFDYRGWQLAPALPDVQPPLQSSRVYDVPFGIFMVDQNWLFQGYQSGPQPPSVLPVIPAMRLPLLGVGNQGP